MDFARAQLEKYGWRDGKGLGKNEDGISEALKPKLKFDNAGVGHQVGDQFTNNWWERVFNNAANNINVASNEDKVKLELREDPVEITTKNYSVRELKKNKGLGYGGFLKTAKLSGSGIESFNVEAPKPLIVMNALTDDELFAACGGRTAHKGARHGLKLSGKLARIEKQEKLLLKKMKNVSLTDDASSLEKKVKKLKKHKEEASSTLAHESDSGSTSSTKKIKNKRKSVTFNDETVIKYYTPEQDINHHSITDENSNNAPSIDPPSTCDEGIEQDIEEANSDLNDCHRSFEEAQRTFNDLSKAERKKLKKKRKLDKKKTATAFFIEEVRDQMSTDENCKKRKLGVDELDIDTKPSPTSKCSKKKKYLKKYVPDKLKKKEERQQKRMLKSIVASLDHLCKISDDE